MIKVLRNRDNRQKPRVLQDVVVMVKHLPNWSTLCATVLLGLGSLVVAPVYAAAPLSDAEMDAKYLDVPVKSPFLKVDADKASAHSTMETKAGILSTNGATALVFSNSADNTLLVGIDQNTRFVGSADPVGLSAGVSNTGIPLSFGSENYSTRWAGNLDQVFVASPDGSRVLQYSTYDNGAEIFYVPVHRTSFIETTVVKN